MANELAIQLDPFFDTGLTLLGKVFTKEGAQQGGDVSLSESSDALYSGDYDVSGLADGEYVVRFETDSAFYGTGKMYVRDGVEVEDWDIMDANIVQVNSYDVGGRGTENSPWGPATNIQT